MNSSKESFSCRRTIISPTHFYSDQANTFMEMQKDSIQEVNFWIDGVIYNKSHWNNKNKSRSQASSYLFFIAKFFHKFNRIFYFPDFNIPSITVISRV